MSWPLVTDFSRALQNPRTAFRDQALKECTIELNNLGQPKARSGNFATVYRGYRPDGREFAIKVFNRAADERRDRYQAISDYLQDRNLSCLVGFEFDEKGIYPVSLSATERKAYPLLIMDWVPGVTLFEWARDRCREGYQEALAIGADVWLQLVRELSSANVVHGDLQHGNVLVSADGYFKLVDYDGMSVPALIGQRNIETGMVPYQHPGRTADTLLFPGLDNFSALVIYVALRALAANPRLWITYVDTPGYDKLLFRKEDFDNPRNSYLYHELMHSPDEQVRDLTHYLFELTRYNLHDIPPIDEVLLWCNSLEDLLSARDWDTAVQLVGRMGAGEQIPPHLAAQVSQAYQRVACRKALEEAIEKGSEEEIERRYVPALLDDYPAAASLVEQARQAPRVREALRLLDSAMRFKTWPKFRSVWQENQELLANRKSARLYREEYKKLLTVDTLRKLLKDPQSEDQAIAEAWRYLQAIGGHETALPLAAEVEARLGRQVKLAKFEDLVRQAPDPPTLKHDKRIVAAWSPELAAGGQQHAALQTYYHAAQARLQLLTRLSELSKHCTLAGEQEISLAGRELPPDYHPKLAERVQVAQQRLAAFRLLKDAFKPPVSDQAVAKAWREVARAKAQAMAPEKLRQMVQESHDRVLALREIAKLPDNLPTLEYDRRLLDLWKPSLEEAVDAAAYRERYELARQRKSLYDRLEQAVATGNAALLDELEKQPAVAGIRLPGDLAQKIERLRKQAAEEAQRNRQVLINALNNGAAGQFASFFDARVVREICDKSPHFQPLATEWIRLELHAPEALGLARDAQASLERVEAPPPPATMPPAEGDSSAVPPPPPPAPTAEPPKIRARWQWPEARFANECRLTVSRQKPRANQSPDELETLYAVDLTREAYERDVPGHEFVVDEAWHDAHVAVWAPIDVGFATFFSAPLDLGQLALKKARSGLWGLFG